MIKTPTGWKRQSIADLCDFSSGFGFKPADWEKSGLPIIRIQNLNGSKNFNYFNGTPEPGWLVQPGELLFAWAGVRGVSFGPTIWKGQLGVLNQHIYRIHPKSGVHKEWLFLVLKLATALIETKAHGFKSSLVHVRKSDIDSQIVLVPDESLQKHIAEIVSTWDKAIQMLKFLLAAHEERKRGLMQQLLTGELRFEEFVKNGSQVKTHFGPFPADWRLTRMATFLTESRVVGSFGNSARKITVKLYGRGAFPRSGSRLGSEQTQYYRRKGGQFIYSKLDFLNGAFAILPQALDGYESTLDLPAFDVSDSVDVEWLRFFMVREKFYTAQIGLAAGGRKAKRVNPIELLKLHIPVPTLKEQNRIASVLNTCDQEIELLGRQLDAVKEQRNELMQKLLMGEVAVKT